MLVHKYLLASFFGAPLIVKINDCNTAFASSASAKIWLSNLCYYTYSYVYNQQSTSVVPNLSRLAAPSGEPIQFCFKVCWQFENVFLIVY